MTAVPVVSAARWWRGRTRRIVVTSRRVDASEILGALKIDPPSTAWLAPEKASDAIGESGAVLLARIGVVLLDPQRHAVDDVRSLTEPLGANISLEGIVSEASEVAPEPHSASVRTAAVEAVGCTDETNAAGVTIALLDTGIDAAIPGLDVRTTELPAIDAVTMDHGTESAAVINGKATTALPFRYSVAPGAALNAAAVLDRFGHARDGDVLLALDWAISMGSRVIALPLAGRPRRGGPDPAYERAANIAQDAGAVILAAAGNIWPIPGRRRPPVAHPANCPTIVAIGAADAEFAGAASTSRGNGHSGIDLLAPGTRVPTLSAAGAAIDASGTSIATAVAAGVAAVHAAADPALRGPDLRERLIRTARPLSGEPGQVGAGLAQVP